MIYYISYITLALLCTLYKHHFFISYIMLIFLTTAIPTSHFFFFLNDPAPPEIYPLPLHAALPIYEDPPDPAGMALAHRHAAAVPGIEITDHADPPRIGRPHREGDALDPVMHQRMGAELQIGRAHV